MSVYFRSKDSAWTLDEAHSRGIIKRGMELSGSFFGTAIARSPWHLPGGRA